MEKISRIDFWGIIKPELTYYNKKWQGENEVERAANKKTILGMYYQELCHASIETLKNAFNQHRQKETAFPKIAQLLRYAPKPVEPTQIPKNEAVEMPPEIAKSFKAVRKQKKLSHELLSEMKTMVRMRWPGMSWDDTFKRWDEENEQRA